MLSYAFEQWGMERVGSEPISGNNKSIQAMKISVVRLKRTEKYALEMKKGLYLLSILRMSGLIR
jgi:hypothetical protein